MLNGGVKPSSPLSLVVLTLAIIIPVLAASTLFYLWQGPPSKTSLDLTRILISASIGLITLVSLGACLWAALAGEWPATGGQVDKGARVFLALVVIAVNGLTATVCGVVDWGSMLVVGSGIGIGLGVFLALTVAEVVAILLVVVVVGVAKLILRPSDTDARRRV